MYRAEPLPEDFGAALELRLLRQLDTSHQQLGKLLNSCRAGAIHFMRSPRGAPIGYVAYASVNRHTLRAASRSGQLPIFGHEWADGPLCLMSEVVFARGWSIECQKQLRQFVRQKRTIAYLRNRVLRLSVRQAGKHRARHYNAPTRPDTLASHPCVTA